MVDFDELLEEIRQYPRKHGCPGGRTQARSWRASNQSADNHAVRMHYASSIRGKIIGGTVHGADDMWQDDIVQALKQTRNQIVPFIIPLFFGCHAAQIADQVHAFIQLVSVRGTDLNWRIRGDVRS